MNKQIETSIERFKDAINISSAELLASIGESIATVFEIVREQQVINRVLLFKNGVMDEFLKSKHLVQEYEDFYKKRSDELNQCYEMPKDEWLLNQILDNMKNDTTND